MLEFKIGERVTFHAQEGTDYRPIEQSVLLPPMTAAQATIFLERSERERAPEWWRALNEWIRSRA